MNQEGRREREGRFRRRREMPSGLWLRCSGCGKMVYKSLVLERGNVCPECNYHFDIPSDERIRLLVDPDSFVEEFGVTYSILHDPQMRGMELYQVLGLPATFLIDREGVLRWMRYGPIPEGDADFLRALEDVLS